MEMSPPKCTCKEAVWRHHGGCCCSGTTADAQVAQLFHPRSRCPEAVTEELCCFQHPSSSCKLLWGPSTFSYCHPCKEKHSIKAGQRGCHLPMTVDKVAQLTFGCLGKAQVSPPALCPATSTALQSTEKCDRKQLNTATGYSFCVTGCALGQCQQLTLYLQSYHGTKHIHLNMGPQTCRTSVKKQAGTGLLTPPQTGLRLMSASGGVDTGDINFLSQKVCGPCMCTWFVFGWPFPP